MSTQTPTQRPFMFWHGHHDELFYVADDVSGRELQIRAHKDVSERNLRLKLLQPAKGQLPELLVKIALKCAECMAEYDRLRTQGLLSGDFAAAGEAHYNLTMAEKKLRRAERVFAKEIKALHDLECLDCPWDGHTIFTCWLVDEDRWGRPSELPPTEKKP
jgi:aminoglycoside phosphotransferase